MATILTFKESWIAENVEKIRTIHPNDDVDKITKYVESVYDDRFRDNKCIIYNNYEQEQVTTTLSKTVDWIRKVKPITTESGSLFKQHSQCWNPDTLILQMKLDERKSAKKQMFVYKEKADAASEKDEKEKFKDLKTRFNLIQKRCKVIVNSEYGVSGLSSSWFFNMACASATTARGQALISTAETAFEDFLADNVCFMDMDECLRFVRLTCSEAINRRLKDVDWVKDKSVSEVAERLRNKFIEDDAADNQLIVQYLQSLNQEDLNRIYYKSNMEEFFRNSKKAKNILSDIVASGLEYLDPMNPPEDFKNELADMRKAVLEYVHFCHPTTDRVYRLKTHKRKCVIVIDTDS